MGKRKAAEEFEVKFFKGVLARKPDHIEAMKALAEVYTRVGEIGKGLVLDLKLSRLLPQDPTVHYNLGCSYALAGDAKKAIATLRKAVILGYRDHAHMANDPDLKNLRNEEEFKEILKICRLARVNRTQEEDAASGLTH